MKKQFSCCIIGAREAVMGGSIKILSTEEAFDGKDFEVQFCKCSYEKCLSNKLPETGRRIYYSVHMVMNGVGGSNRAETA